MQGAVGFFGYELIHRLQAVLTVVLFMTFVVFAVKLVGGHDDRDTAGGVRRRPCRCVRPRGDDRVQPHGVLGRLRRRLQPLPARASSPARVFGFTFAGIVLAYVFVQGIGIAAGDLVADHTAEGVRR